MAETIKADVKGTGTRITSLREIGMLPIQEERTLALELAIMSTSGVGLGKAANDELLARAAAFHSFIVGKKQD